LADAITTTVLSCVGAVTGIVGSILGYLGYRQSRQIKSLDLRLELRKSVSDLRATVEELPGLLQRARESRAAINAARGILHTGAFEAWKKTWEADIATARGLGAELPGSTDTLHRAGQSHLEAKLAAMHTLAKRSGKLRDKYLGELSEDDRQRDHLREDMRIHRQGKLGTRRE
jgi:hypothetical protein